MKTVLEQAIEQITPQLIKVSREIHKINEPFYKEFNSSDYFQEIILYIIGFYNRLEENKKNSLNDVVPILRRVISLEKRHYISNKAHFSERGKGVQVLRSSRSMYTEKDGEHRNRYNEFNFSKYSCIHQKNYYYEDYDYEDFREKAIEEIKRYELQVNGITEFFMEVTSPSNEIEDKFRKYCQEAEKNGKVKRGLSGPHIPPVVLTELLGHSRNRIKVFKRYISYVLSDIGIPESLIRNKWNLSEHYFNIRK